MIKNIIILAILVAGVYFFLKKFTVYRCPKCRSRHIVPLKEENYTGTEKKYICRECCFIVRKQK